MKIKTEKTDLEKNKTDFIGPYNGPWTQNRDCMPLLQKKRNGGGGGATDLVDADFGLHILQALLDDGDERCRGHQGSIDVGLADVALYAKRKR